MLMRLLPIPVLMAAALASPLASGRALTLDRVAWLAGCWRSESPRRVIEENWMAARGGTMMGVSRTVRGDSLAEFELIVLRERGGHSPTRRTPRASRAPRSPRARRAIRRSCSRTRRTTSRSGSATAG
jgi:hypothetical protein